MALEPKQLVYQGTFGKEDNPLPKVKYEDIPKERRKKLHRKRLYNVVPEEFEEWLAVELDFNKYRYISEGIDFEHTKKRLADEEDQKSLAQYYRAEYNHMQKVAIWEEEHLTPLVKELTGMAKSNPQYDCHFLYKLERQKLVCMEAYLSHSRVADASGEYVGKKWLVLCINLLDYILEYKEIIKAQIKRMNLRNLHGLVDAYTIQQFKKEKYAKKDRQCMKTFHGKDIYVRKMERLYHLIRLYKTRFWWE